ncbi:MAG: zinc ABC transporter substrate-binding protein [Myxococcales bacterium]|nr:zinc ABC transporter substrate-binding protein [Myxococcales bacterium]
MIQKLFVALTVALAALLAPALARAEVKVVTTVPTLASLAKAIGGSKIKVVSLSLPTQDPHFVDAKPSLALELSQADLLLVVGQGLESGWLPALLTGARNAGIQAGAHGHLDCSGRVRVLDVSQNADRSQGDVHPDGNPHYLFDPRAVGAVAEGIARRLGELDPAEAAFFQARLEKFQSRLGEARAAVEGRLARLRGVPVIGYHKSWPYLADWLGVELVDYVEPKPGIPPTPAHVARLLATARKRNVRAILQESYYPEESSALVAEKSGAALVVLPSGADFEGGQSYFAYLEALTQKLESIRP